MNEKIQNKLKQLPGKSGVYIMRDAAGGIIYVGKAKVLKNRVKQYFTGSHQAKVAAMVAQIDDFEYIICDSELEALVLECNMIKRHRPYYNILLKDDKHYPYIRIDLKEDYPAVTIVRSVKPDGAKYFGPYIAAHIIRDLLKSIYEAYPLRTCKKDILKAQKRGERPCLNYQMGKCFAPCAGRISKEDYRLLVSEVESMLGSGRHILKKRFTEEMARAARELRYEYAAQMRDKLRLLARIEERQKAGLPNLSDKDVFGAACGSDRSVVQAFFVRGGNLSLAEKYTMSAADNEAEVLLNFLLQYYESAEAIPKTIQLSHEPEDMELIAELLSEKRGARVNVCCPVRGDGKKLAGLAKKNASDAIRLKESEEKRRIKGLEELKKALSLRNFPHRIECYDISNTQGTDSVASMVVMIDGEAKKKQYRKFKIKTVEGANDFASMAEVLERRLLRTLNGSESFSSLPDLIVVDGGKGQLSSAYDVLCSLGLEEEIDICGLAKREEELFLPHNNEPVVLSLRSMPLRLVTGLRDEAHRFAITYHRSLREKRQKKSVLDTIPGVGEARKKQLLNAFGSVEGVKAASEEDIAALPGMPKKLAASIFEYLHV